MEFVKRFKVRDNGRRIIIGAVYNQELAQIHFGVAVCKPGEAFNKKKGADKAIGRAKSKKPYLMVTVPLPDRGNINGYFHAMAQQLEEAKNNEIELRLQVQANLHG